MSSAFRKDSFYGNTKSLIDLCDSITDCHHSTPKWTNEGKLVIRNFNIKNGKLQLNDLSYTDEENFEERIRRKRPQEGDLIITREAPMGEVCIIPEGLECCLGQRMVLIKPDKNKINGKYLLYALQSEFVQIQIQKSDKTGSIVSNLRIPVLEELRIPVFGTIIENKIGSIMDSIVSKIELNNRINSELEAMAKTLYDYWFVQFDFPNEEGKPYKTSGGAMVWNEELNREIPEGWEVKNLGDEIEIQRGVSYTSKEIEGEGIPMINLNSFKLNGVYKPEGIKSYSGKYSEKNIAKSGDLLIAATDVTRNADIIGRAILVPSYYENDLVFSMDIAKIISNTIPSSYLMMLFNSNHYHNYIKWYASGTIVLHLNLDGTNRYLTEIPPINLIQKFDILYQQISKRIDNTAIENQKLSSLRDWLLPMLMNGQVKVGE